MLKVLNMESIHNSISTILILVSYRTPQVKYPKKMSEKSKSYFLTLKTEDPASNAGIIALYKVTKMQTIYS